MSEIKVVIIMGSDSDLPAVSAASKELDGFGVAHDARIMSAHRTPNSVVEYVREAESRGADVFICAAGMAAHLAGVVAAHTTKPVIGVPMSGGMLDGLDALLSTVQMPPGVPVLTTAVGKPGVVNAALAAVQILALSDPDLAEKMRAHKESMAEKILARDKALQQKGVDGYRRAE
jgi:phosphoribosylaminoimidazole carboxylase PurE protein